MISSAGGAVSLLTSQVQRRLRKAWSSFREHLLLRLAAQVFQRRLQVLAA